VPETCNSLDVNCGPTSDGCGGLIDDCGTCDAPHICGGGGSNICGGGNGDLGCIPQTCDDLPVNCGPVSDGCGGLLDDCGTCAAPHVCGGGGLANVCGGGNGDPNCIPMTCDDLGVNCGPVADGCGGLTEDCGTCDAPEICGGDGVPNVCGTGANQACENFCLQQTACDGGATTTVTGTVFAPNGTLPLPEALVYVPNEATTYPYGLEPFVDGVAGGVCEQCAANVTGAPLISTLSAVDGTFTLTNVPVGNDIPLVIQLGRWRRLVTVDVPACVTTQVPAANTRLPTMQGEGNAMDNIPQIAIATGDVDALECVIRKLGVDDDEFTNPDDGGRIHFYQDNGAEIDNSTPSYDELFADQDTLDGYDALIFACRGGDHDIDDDDQHRILDVSSNAASYVNKGGRAYFTHFSYSWLYDIMPSDALPWPGGGVDSASVNADSWDDVVGEINTGFPKGALFAEWLGLPTVNALTDTNPPRIDVEEARNNMGSPLGNVPAESWIHNYQDDPEAATLHLTFNTPWGAPPSSQCGRVLFSGFHVTTNSSTNGDDFPSECNNNAMTPQEKVLAFMLFDLTSCIQPFNPDCDQLSCIDQGVTCGLAGDGCGGIINCGNCPPPADCVPLDCDDQQIDCGPAGDGCGDVIDCGPCPDPSCDPLSCEDQGIVCGEAGDGCGEVLDCGSCECIALTCEDLDVHCGPAGDGCGELLDCGDCPPGETCGGGGVPNECGVPECTPDTCEDVNAECGLLADGCGHLVDCGECLMGQECGGNGVANKCAQIQ
jgi:hypothetical protein